MTKCKHIVGRQVPIQINENEYLTDKNPDYFFMCLIYGGTAIIMLNGERCYIGTNTIICLHKDDYLHVLYKNKLIAKSISFAPEFINVNLNYDTIFVEDYPDLCRKHHYPSFDLFYKRNILNNGIMPLDIDIFKNLSDYFDEIIQQVKDQPDKKWSCRSRANLITLIEKTSFFNDEIMSDNRNIKPLVKNVLNYIQLNLYSDLSLEKLCDLFSTNRTTLSNEFKKVTGATITNYVMDTKLDLAKYALAFTELSVDEISVKYGFKNITYFSKMFKTKEHMSPLKYRQHMKAGRKEDTCCK